jgi:hypothetical protein
VAVAGGRYDAADGRRVSVNDSETFIIKRAAEVRSLIDRMTREPSPARIVVLVELAAAAAT